MSYLLFSQTSTANGTRNTWNVAPTGTSTTTDPLSVGTIGGILQDVANSTFSEAAVQGGIWNAGESYADGVLLRNGQAALYNLSDVSAAVGYQFNATLLGHLNDTVGNVLNAAAWQTADGSANNRTLDNTSNYDAAARSLDIGLADINWNDIKNVEVLIANAETGTAFDALTVRSFVDARVKIGDTNFGACFSAAQAGANNTAGAERFSVEILDGKRGQVDGSESDMALDVSIDVWANGGWQNSFANLGSNFNDTFEINHGQLAVVRNISEFGLGMGVLLDADGTFDSSLADTDQFSLYNGQHTTLLTNLGRGQDRYDATNGVAVVAPGQTVKTELATVDWVWGGSGDDVIKTAGGHDRLFGDFGSWASGAEVIGQSADTTDSLKLGVGGSNIENWVVGTGFEVYGRSINPSGGNVAGPDYRVTGSNLADRAQFEVPQSASAQDAATWASLSGGIGISRTEGDSRGGTQSNPEISTNENDGVRSEFVGVDLNRAVFGATVELSLFYSQDGGSGAIETALIWLGKDVNGNNRLDDNVAGEVLGSFVLRADGTVANVTGFGGNTVVANALAGPSGAYAANNPGLGSASFTSALAFEKIEFRSNGLFTKDASGSVYTAVNNADVSDFYLRGICLDMASEEGNDILDAGSGRDVLVGGGDRATVTAGPATNAEKIVNGGFETKANNATADQGGYYLTAGGGNFGWTTASGTNMEVQQGGTGGLAAFAGSNKLELDSHPASAALSTPAQSFSTVAGLSYTLSFAFAERQGPGDGSSNFEVLWDGQVVGAFTNPTGVDNWAFTASNGASISVTPDGAGWNTATITGLLGDGSGGISFRNTNTPSNTHGAFLDNVSVKGASVQSLTVEGGDRLFLGGADNARDTVVFEAGDGFDLVHGYDRSPTGTANDDVIDLNGVTVSAAAQAVVNGDLGLLLTFSDGGRMFLAGVASQADVLFV